IAASLVLLGARQGAVRGIEVAASRVKDRQVRVDDGQALVITHLRREGPGALEAVDCFRYAVLLGVEGAEVVEDQTRFPSRPQGLPQSITPLEELPRLGKLEAPEPEVGQG